MIAISGRICGFESNPTNRYSSGWGTCCQSIYIRCGAWPSFPELRKFTWQILISKWDSLGSLSTISILFFIPVHSFPLRFIGFRRYLGPTINAKRSWSPEPLSCKARARPKPTSTCWEQSFLLGIRNDSTNKHPALYMLKQREDWVFVPLLREILLGTSRFTRFNGWLKRFDWSFAAPILVHDLKMNPEMRPALFEKIKADHGGLTRAIDKEGLW